MVPDLSSSRRLAERFQRLKMRSQILYDLIQQFLDSRILLLIVQPDDIAVTGFEMEFRFGSIHASVKGALLVNDLVLI